MRLGRIQQSVFDLLTEQGEWWSFAPRWTWGTPAETIRVLEALAKRGIVKKSHVAGKAGFTYRLAATAHEADPAQDTAA